MKIGDKVLISPDLTKLPDWTHGTVIEVENNPFFGYQDLFKLQNEERCTH